MTISTYANLQTAVANWLARASDTDISTNAPDFIALAEQDIRTDLDTSFMEAKNTAFSIDQEFITLASISTQLTAIRRIYLTTASPNSVLMYRSPDQLITEHVSSATGTPIAFTIEAAELQFRPIPDTTYSANIAYRKWLDPLATTATNSLLTNWPGVYLYSSLREAALFLKDNEAAQLWDGKYQRAIMGVQRADNRLNYSGGVLTIRTDTGAP